MTGLTPLQGQAWEIIKLRGKKQPITGKQLADRIGLKDRDSGKEGADMRSIIHALRVKGYPVCANGNGYYCAKDESELEDYIASLQGRIDKEHEALSGLRRGRTAYFMPKPSPGNALPPQAGLFGPGYNSGTP